jgi:LmbE family N-acetylglucosaminyl deacetylase
MRVLLLAAHPDDLALSIGGLLARLTGRAAISAVTVFGQSAWVRPGFDPADQSITELRRAEEMRFFAMAGIRGRILALADAGLRGYSEVSEIGPDPHRRRTAAVVARTVEPFAKDFRPMVTFAPAAIGRHVDHVAVRDAALRLRPRCGALVLYEDLPYARPRSGYHPPVSCRGLRTSHRAHAICISPVRKRQFLAIYRSQLEARDERAVGRHAFHRRTCAGPAERIFVPRDRRVARLLQLLGK